MASPAKGSFEMNLSDLLSEGQIIEKMECTTVKKAVEQLVDRLVEIGLVDKKATAVKRIMEREGLASTALGAGVAIPHARMDVGDKPVIAIARHVTGLDFAAPDAQPVNLIFLLLWQPERPGLFNQLFANLVTRLNNPAFRNDLIEAKGTKAMIGLMKGVKVDWMPNVETSLDGTMLITLQELEKKCEKDSENEQKVRHQIEILRQDLDSSILWRYDRLKKLHGVAVVPVEGGICKGCSMQLSSGLSSAMLKNPNALYVCEKCGRFLMINAHK